MSHLSQGEGIADPSDNIPPREEKIHYLEPTVIVIDDRQQQEKESAANPQAKSPLSLRFLCVLGLIFCSIFGVGMFLMSLVSTLIATCYLYRNANLNRAMLHFWKLSAHTLIASLGFVLGLISPGLGLSLIVLYFSITGEQMDNNFLHAFIKKSFNKF